MRRPVSRLVAADAVVAALCAVVVGVGLQVVSACRPAVPLFDHAVLLADMLHAPPHLLVGHNEHLPVMPRLVFWIEALTSSGETRIPVTIGILSLVVAVLVACRAHRSRLRLTAAAVVLAAVLRPSLAWSVSWATNIQYPLALVGASIGLWATAARRYGLLAVGATVAALSSAEGLLVLPVAAVLLARGGERRASVGAVLGAVVLVVLATTSGRSGLQVPQSLDDVRKFGGFAAELWAYPWSLRLWVVAVGPVVGASLVALRRSSCRDVVLSGWVLYGLGFAALVVVGRWWLGSVHHRYTLGASVAVAGVVAAGAVALGEVGPVRAPGAGLRARGLLGALALTMAIEAVWLGGPIRRACLAEPPAGTAFWEGQSDDGSAAHPGFPEPIVQELRAHLWRAGLYRPSARPPLPLPSR